MQQLMECEKAEETKVFYLPQIPHVLLWDGIQHPIERRRRLGV
jgi:hypothetical protein